MVDHATTARLLREIGALTQEDKLVVHDGIHQMFETYSVRPDEGTGYTCIGTIDDKLRVWSGLFWYGPFNQRQPAVYLRNALECPKDFFDGPCQILRTHYTERLWEGGSYEIVTLRPDTGADYTVASYVRREARDADMDRLQKCLSEEWHRWLKVKLTMIEATKEPIFPVTRPRRALDLGEE